MSILSLGIILLITLLVSSYKVVQYQRQRLLVKHRLSLVAAQPQKMASESLLFAWEQRAGPLLRRWAQLQTRFDALFKRKAKKWLLIGLLLLTASIWFSTAFLTVLPRIFLVLSALLATVSGCYWIMRARQKQAFETAFTQVLGQLSRAVSAGISVPQAIAQVADYQQGMLAHEFALIRDKLEIGISLKQALKQASIRLPYVSFHFFTVALILNEENGGQLREVLHNLSRTLHDNAAIKMKINSLTAEPRMTALILASLPVLLISAMYFRNPASFNILIDNTTGHWVLAYVMASMGVGMAIIQVLTKVKS